MAVSCCPANAPVLGAKAQGVAPSPTSSGQGSAPAWSPPGQRTLKTDRTAGVLPTTGPRAGGTHLPVGRVCPAPNRAPVLTGVPSPLELPPPSCIPTCTAHTKAQTSGSWAGTIWQLRKRFGGRGRKLPHCAQVARAFWPHLPALVKPWYSCMCTHIYTHARTRTRTPHPPTGPQAALPTCNSGSPSRY